MTRKRKRMNNIGPLYISSPDGKMHRLGELSETDISLSEEEVKKCDRLLSSEVEFKSEVEITIAEGKRKLNPYRFFASGCDKSTYNAMTLREDGYLSPKNGWIE